MALRLYGDGNIENVTSINTVSSDELSNLDGLSNLQAQIDAKAPSSSPTFAGGVTIDNTDNTNILNVGDDLNLVRYHWRYAYNYPDSPAILRITRTTGGGYGLATYLISCKARGDSNSHSNALFYISMQAQYQDAGYSITASRLAGTTDTGIYQVTNSGSNLTLEVYPGSAGYNDSNEFTVLELNRGQDNNISFNVIGYSQRGGGTKIA